MEKRKYYVSVQSRSIMNEQGQGPYEFEIEATDSELERLQSYFGELEDADNAAYFRMHIVALPYHHDPENDQYDRAIRACYGLIYELGTEETRTFLNAHLNNLSLGHGEEEGGEHQVMRFDSDKQP